MYEKSFIKIYWIWHAFEIEQDSLWEKTDIFCYQTPICLKFYSCFWFLLKDEKVIKADLWLNLFEL